MKQNQNQKSLDPARSLFVSRTAGAASHSGAGSLSNMKTIQLIKDPYTLVVPPNIQVELCGVKLARIFPSNVVQLEYADGNTESANLTIEQLAAGRENFFSLVSAVQSMRGPSTR